MVGQVHTFNTAAYGPRWGEPRGIISWEEAEGLSQPGLPWSAWQASWFWQQMPIFLIGNVYPRAVADGHGPQV